MSLEMSVTYFSFWFRIYLFADNNTKELHFEVKMPNNSLMDPFTMTRSFRQVMENQSNAEITGENFRHSSSIQTCNGRKLNRNAE